MHFESSSSSSSPETVQKYWFPVPKDYTFLRVLGHGGYGTVLECVKKETGEHVAIKVPDIGSLAHEAAIMKKLMHHHLDESNIIKFKDEVFVKCTRLLVLEKLDITLDDYLVDLQQPMRLEDIRTVIQQMAVALNALKSIGMIHTDLKTDNIMMVDHVKQPFRVKLTDFGLAMFRSEAKAGKYLQTPAYRAPEIILGLPFSEAIDVWSLGCVLAIMAARVVLFGTQSEYCILQYMISLLGPPPQHLIQAGRKSKFFFNKLPCGLWQLKTHMEYFGNYNSYVHRRHPFGFLDKLKTVCLEKDNPAEADERRECIELLKAMLQWDEKERITPSGILNHPFITKSFLNSSSHLSTCNEPEPSTSQVFMVQPPDHENRMTLTGLSDEASDLEDCKAEDDRENIKGGENNVITENSQDMKNSEDNENSVNEEISVNEDSVDSEAVEDTEDTEDSQHSVDIEDSQDDEDTEDTEVSGISSDIEDSDTSEVSKDNEYREVKQKLHDIVHKEDGEKEQKTKKKKKNCFQRMKKTFCSCCCVSDVMD